MMVYRVPLAQADELFPEFDFVTALTPSAHKAAFHVRDATGKDLCLKLISPSFGFDRLEREVKALIEVDHPHVVGFEEYTFSVTESEQRHYIVEEFVQGEDLSSHLGSQWSATRLKSFFTAFFAGLAALHSRRIVHRDLKPSNVRVRSEDTLPVIIDLGLARHLELSDLTHTSEGAQIGTPTYFSPEQFVGTKYDIDQRTDLFAGGLLLYKAATGVAPFYRPGMDQRTLRERVCGDFDGHIERSEFRELESYVQLLIGRLLARDRAQRPASAEQVVRILNQVVDDD